MGTTWLGTNLCFDFVVASPVGVAILSPRYAEPRTDRNPAVEHRLEPHLQRRRRILA
jgi:hypothetical protein